MTVLDQTPETPGTPATPESLRGKVVSGLRWSFLNHLVVRLVSVVTGIVLARLLAPEDFGQFAVAMLVWNVLVGLNDLGLLLAVVRWKGDLRAAAGTAFTLATACSTALYVICFLGAPAFASFMQSPESTWLLRVLLVTMILDGLTTVPHGLLIRDFRQAEMAKSEFAAIPVASLAMLLIALAGGGAWSFVLGQVLGCAVTAVFIYRAARFVPRPRFDPAVARPMLAYGVPLALTSLVEYILLNADYVVVGRMLGPVALGFYLLAFNVSSWPLAILTDAVRRVSIAGFAALEGDPEAVRRSFQRTFRIVIALALPLVLGLAVLAEPVVATLYGPKWAASAQVLMFLAVLGGVRVTVGYVFDLLVGIGRSRLTLVLKCVWLAVLVPALIVGARWDGIRGVAIAHVLVGILVVGPLFLLATRRVGVRLGEIGADLWRPLVGAVLGIGAALLVLRWLDAPVPELLLGGTCLVAIYTAVAAPWRLVRQRLAARRAAAPAEA